jgi:carboxymethylenebutenolidase
MLGSSMRTAFLVSIIGSAIMASVAVANQPEVADATGGSPPNAQSAAAREFRKTAIPVVFPCHGLALCGWIYKPPGEGPFPAVIWNHGSEKNPVRHPELGRFYTQHGYVLFVPVREGHGKSPGQYVGDALAEYAASLKGMAGDHTDILWKKAVELHEFYNRDVVAAVAWLAAQPFVDRMRMAVTGVSYGGIQTLLAAEKGLRVRAFVPFAPGAMSWGNQELQAREMLAVRRAAAPLFLLQAQNDYSVGPSEVLGPIIRGKGGLNRAKLYPPFGVSHEQGHAGFACSEQGIAIWGQDVLDFLRRTGVGGGDSR